MSFISSTVESVESLTDFVYKIRLNVSPENTFKAGQYLQVVMSETDKRPFSIANAPNEQGQIELHIGATPENKYAYDVVQKAKIESKLNIELGIGNAYLRDGDEPIILIAGGTGYAYTKSILEHSLNTNPSRSLVLYWGAKSAQDLYELPNLQKLGEQYPDFKVIPVIEQPVADWGGKTGLVHEAVISDYGSFTEQQVYTAGRFEMAAVIRDSFLPLGLSSENLYGDAFAFI